MKNAKPRDRATPGGGGGGAKPADWSRFAVALSGGAYAAQDRQNGIGDAGEPLVCVNSYGYSFEKTTMYGPFMASASQARTLYEALD